MDAGEEARICFLNLDGLFFSRVPAFVLRVVAHKVDVLDSADIILDECDSIVANLFHVVTRPV